MHDAVTAERLGIPALSVMTTRFVSAAELMRRVLGMPEHEFAVIDHPVSSASDVGLFHMAHDTIGFAQKLLLAK